MHKTERVSDGDGVEDPFASQRVDAAISKSGGHDAPGLTIHLNGAKLKVEIHSLEEEKEGEYASFMFWCKNKNILSVTTFSFPAKIENCRADGRFSH